MFTSSRRAQVVAAACLSLTVSGCLGDFLTTPDRSSRPPGTMKRLVVTPGSATLDAIGDVLAFAAAWADSGAPGSLAPAGRCSWQVGDPVVATVDEGGNVRSRGNGDTTVRATCGDTTAVAALTVRQAVTAVGVEPGNLNLKVGESEELRAVVRDRLGQPVERPLLYRWASSNAFAVSVVQDPEQPDQARAVRHFPGEATVEVRVEGEVARASVR